MDHVRHMLLITQSPVTRRIREVRVVAGVMTRAIEAGQLG